MNLTNMILTNSNKEPDTENRECMISLYKFSKGETHLLIVIVALKPHYLCVEEPDGDGAGVREQLLGYVKCSISWPRVWLHGFVYFMIID